MADTRKTTLGIAGDASDFKSAAEQVKQAGRSMAQDVAQSAQQASKAVAGMGDGAAGAAKKIGDSQASIADSVKRSTDQLSQQQTRFIASLEKQAVVASQGKAAYLELRASQLGVGEAAAASIAKIRAAETAQVALGTSAKQTAQQLRQVAPQVTDIVTQLAAGQAPLQILIQQGGQLKDVFGGIGPAAKALGGYLLGLVNVYTVAGGAIAALAVAYVKGAQESRAFTAAATISGNELAKSLSTYTGLRDAITDIGATKGKAAEVLTEIASKGELAGAAIRQIAEAAILMEKATGQATEKTIAQFIDLAKSPTDAVAKLNDQYRFLTAATYAQVKALEDQGKKQEAADVAERAYAEALKTRAQSVVDSAGLMEKAWVKVKDGAKSAWDAMLGVGRTLSTAEQLAQVQSKIARAQGPFDATPGSGNAELRAQLPILQEQAKVLQRKLEIEQGYAVASARDAELEKDKIDFIKEGAQYLTKQQQMQREITRERERDSDLIAQGLLTEAQMNERILAIRKKYVETTGEGEVAALKARLDTLRAFNAELSKQIISGIFPTDSQPTQAEQKVLALQNELKGSILGKARAEKEAALAVAQSTVAEEQKNQALLKQRDLVKAAIDESAKQASAVYDQAQAIRQQAEEQEAANAVFGKGVVAVAQYRLAQMQATLAQLDATENADPKYIAGLNAKIEAQKRYVTALQEAADKQLAANNLRLTEGNDRESQLLEYELSIVGQVADVRALLIERRRIELEYAQKIADIDRSDASESAKAASRATVEQQKAVALSNATTKAVVEQWQRASDEINDAITNAFVDAFENGGSLGKNLVQALKREFSNLVLRPTIQAIVNSSGLPSLLGQAAGSLTGIGQMGGIFNPILSGASSLFGGGSMFGAAASQSAAATEAFALSDSVYAGSTAAAGSAGILSTVGAAMPYIGAALLAAQALGLFDSHGPKTESGYGPLTRAGSDPSGATAIAQGIQQSYSQVASALGLADTTLKDLTVFFSKDPNGTAPTQLQVAGGSFNRIANGLGFENVGRSDAEFQQAVSLASAQLIVKNLQEQVSGPVGDFLKSIDITSSSLETLNQAVQTATDVGTLDKALVGLGDTFSALAGLTVQNKEALSAQFGGIQNLVGGLASFNDKFLTDAEKQAAMQQQLTATFQQAGVVLPASIEAYKQAVLDAEQNLDSEAGRAAFATLIQNAGLFYDAAQLSGTAIGEVTDTLQQALDKLADPIRTVQDIAQSIFNLQKETVSLNVQLLNAQGATTVAKALQRQIDTAGMTDAEIAIYDYNQGIRAQIDALNAAAQAAQEAAQQQQAEAQQQYDLTTQLLQLQGDTQALRERELALLDPTSQAIQRQIYALQDQQAAQQAAAQAAQEAAQAQAEAARQAEAVARERYGLETQLLQLQGNTAALRERELAALDPSNRALQEQIYALEDAKAAEDALAQARQKQKQAADELKSTYAQLASTLRDEVQRIRGVMLAQTSSALFGQFAILTAKARALDQGAAQQLPGVAEALLASAQQTATSRAELMTVRGQVAQSLEITADHLAALSPNKEVVAELRAIRSQNDDISTRQAKHEKAIEKLNERMVSVLEEWEGNDFQVTGV